LSDDFFPMNRPCSHKCYQVCLPQGYEVRSLWGRKLTSVIKRLITTTFVWYFRYIVWSTQRRMPFGTECQRFWTSNCRWQALKTVLSSDSILINILTFDLWPILLALRSKAKSEAALLLGPRVRIPLTVRLFNSCDCIVLCRQRLLRRADHQIRGVRQGVCVCVLETSIMKQPRPEVGCWAPEKNDLWSLTNNSTGKVCTT
jgi:hypothetical protein